jgi:hypothetical protein
LRVTFDILFTIFGAACTINATAMKTVAMMKSPASQKQLCSKRREAQAVATNTAGVGNGRHTGLLIQRHHFRIAVGGRAGRVRSQVLFLEGPVLERSTQKL